MKTNNPYMIKKKDIMLILAILTIGIILLLIFKFAFKNGNTVTVSVNNKVIASYPLSEDRRQVFYLDDNSYNELLIENNTVRIITADCPDLLCVKQYKINRCGETIVCLPHKLVVEIISK